MAISVAAGKSFLWNGYIGEKIRGKPHRVEQGLTRGDSIG